MSVQISPEQSYAYAELLEILSFTQQSLVNKIPKKLLSLFRDNALSTYEHHLDRNIPIEEQNISKKTAALLVILSLNYWCENDEQKREIKSVISANSKKAEEKLREKYNPDNIFNNSKPTASPILESNDINSDESNQNLPVDINNLPWYKKIILSLKNFLIKIKNK